MKRISLTFGFLFISFSSWLGGCYIPKGEIIKFYSVSATIYNPEASQCDSSPLLTADGSKISIKNANNLRWIAVSRDLLQEFNYGDTIEVFNHDLLNGYWVIHDCMNKRFKRKIDFLQNKKGFYGSWKNIKIRKSYGRRRL